MHDMPTKFVKMNRDIFTKVNKYIFIHFDNFSYYIILKWKFVIANHFSYCITCGEFPDKLKHALIPIHKKNEKGEKTN